MHVCHRVCPLPGSMLTHDNHASTDYLLCYQDVKFQAATVHALAIVLVCFVHPINATTKIRFFLN